MSRVKIINCLLIVLLSFSSCCRDEPVVETSVFLTLPFDSEGGTIDINISSDKIVFAPDDYPNWINISKTGNTGEQIFHLTLSKNESGIMRENSLVFSAESVSQFSYSVLAFNNLGANISIEGKSTGEIKINGKSLPSNISFKITMKQSAQ